MSVRKICVGLVLLCLCESALGQHQRSDSSFTVLGRWAWGLCGGIARYNDYLVIGNGFLVQLLDFSTPESPAVMSELLLESHNSDMAIRDSLVYVVENGGLNILDVSVPSQITSIGQLDLGGILNRIELADSLAFILSYFGGLKIVDVSDPSQPFLVTGIGAGGEQSSCLAASERIVYIGNPTFPDIDIYDITDPTDIKQSLLQINGYASYARAIDTLLFVGLTNGNWNLQIYNIVDRLNPIFESEIWVGSDVLSVSQDSDSLYVGTRDTGLQLLDISDVSSPVVISDTSRSVPEGVGGNDIIVADSLLHVSLSTGIWTLGTQYDSWFSTGSFPGHLIADDSHLFVSQNWSGIRVLETSDPSEVVSVSLAEFNGISVSAALDGEYGYFVGDENLQVVDFNDKENPLVVGSVPIEGNAVSARDELCVIGGTNMVSFYDVSVPSAPKFISNYTLSGEVTGVGLLDTVSFVAVQDSGLIILKVSDPSNPSRLGRVLDEALGLSVKNSLLFAATTTGLTIVDATNPHNPMILGSAITSGLRSSFVSIDVNENFAYLAYEGLHVVDISDIENPFETFVYIGDPFPKPSTVAVRGDTVFVADHSGVWVLKNDLVVNVEHDIMTPTTFMLQQNYPNPFNSTTRIGFSLSRIENIVLDVYNVAGERVATLFEGVMNSGSYDVDFNADKLASGVYFYRISSSTAAQTKKMTLVK